MSKQPTAAHLVDPNHQAADYTLTLKADSGYRAVQKGRCSANQYGQAVAALGTVQPPKAAGGELAKAVLRFENTHGDIWHTPEETNDWAAIVKMARGEA